MNRFVRWINSTLLCAIVLLGLSIAHAQTGGTEDPPGFTPLLTPVHTNCETFIDMTGNCRPENGWFTTWQNRRIICKSDGVNYNILFGGCCEYEAWDKVCLHATQGSYARGYKAAYRTEFSNASCSKYTGLCG